MDRQTTTVITIRPQNHQGFFSKIPTYWKQPFVVSGFKTLEILFSANGQEIQYWVTEIHTNCISWIKIKETTLQAFNGTNLSFSFKRVRVQSIHIIKHQVVVKGNVCTIMTNMLVLINVIMLENMYVINQKLNTLWLF